MQSRWRTSFGAGIALLAAWCESSPAAAGASSIAGRVEVHAGFTSSEDGLSRQISICVPPEYDADPSRRYPVVYAFDGQDLFDAATAAGGDEWAIDELLQASPAGIAPVLVVGIESHGWLEQAPPGSHPQAHADVFLRFVAHELKPFVDRAYRTRPDAASTLLMGEGIAGLGALYGTWTFPATFGNAIALGLPDVDARSTAWSASAPRGARVQLWIDQRGASDAIRPSSTQFVASLQRGAEVQFHVAGAQASRVVRVAAALRALCPG